MHWGKEGREADSTRASFSPSFEDCHRDGNGTHFTHSRGWQPQRQAVMQAIAFPIPFDSFPIPTRA